MSITAYNKNGQMVNVGDRVSITAKVVSVSGSGSKATVTVQAPLDPSTFNCQANDARAVDQLADASHVCCSIEGNAYGAAGDDVTVLGWVTAIASPTYSFGDNLVLTVTLETSGNSITTAAGNCQSAT